MAQRFYAIIMILAFGFTAMAQTNMDESLAIQFYQNQEYDKAAELFEKLYKKSPGSNLYYRYLYNSYIAIKEFDQLEKVVKKNIKQNPDEPAYVIDLGYLYLQEGDMNAGKKQYESVLDDLPSDVNKIRSVANAFIGYAEFELAARAYEKGQEMVGQPALFAFELADLYQRLNNKQKTIESYLAYIQYNPANVQLVRNKFQDLIQDPEYFDFLKEQLLSGIQKTGKVVYSELLIWQFVQAHDFTSAYIQAKALDKRNNENGFRLVNLARSATDEKDYKTAIECYEYVIAKGKMNQMYQVARQELLTVRKLKITDSYNYTQEDLEGLLAAYNEFISEFGVSRYTVNTILDKAKLQAFYFHNLPEAISILEDLMKVPQLDNSFRAQVKLELGDYYLLKGEPWEASLLYSQVDKAMKDEPLGELARFKNAKLSYYQGDFEWSQAQLDILKAATSELIANDALELSVFIMDNLGLDTTLYPMKKYAEADLLVYQNRLDDALDTLDKLVSVYPNHSLADDILMMRAQVFLKKKDFEKAAQYLEEIRTKYGTDLLGDNATYMLAKLYDTVLNDQSKAMDLYQSIIVDYKDSIFVVEARKRFREIRGDKL